jgi:hypothetical protein
MAVNNLNTPGVGIQPSIVDAKGDLIAGTAADAVGRLGVGTNGHVLVAASGETTGLKWEDYQPLVAFRAKRASSNQSIAGFSFVKVQFNSEDFDTNNNYDPTTNYRFTPTVAGYYQINATVTYTEVVNSCQCRIYKNNSNFVNGSNATGAWTTVSGLVYLNGSSDYVEIFTAHLEVSNKNVSSNSNETTFDGILVKKA